jgi:hypothetical protein
VLLPPDSSVASLLNALIPTSVSAQEQRPVPQEIRAHKFVLLDEVGVDRGVFAFDRYGNPRIQMMDADGRTWEGRRGKAYRNEMLPDETCPTCPRKPAK